MTSHSSDLLYNRGISPHEVLILEPNNEGTVVKVAADIRDIRALLKSGMSLSEAVLPRTKPTNIKQFTLEF